MNQTSLLEKIQNSFIGRDTRYPLADGTSGARRYLDSAASTLMMKPAFDVALNFLHHYASTHSEMHYSARGATRAYQWAHRRILAFVGADEKKYSTYFAGSGATAGFNRIAAELAIYRPGRDVVLVSEMEHHSNDLPHRHHANQVVHLPSLGEGQHSGGLNLDLVAEAVQKYGERINYIAVTAASNVTGVITPVHPLAQLAHSVGAYLLVDASQMIAHAPVSMQSQTLENADIDILIFSGHKIYAPGSPGTVIARSELLSQVTPVELGGGMVEDVNLHQYMPSAELPDRMEAGTPNIVGAITLAVALDILARIGMHNIQNKEQQLITLAWNKLSAISDVKLYGPAPDTMSRTGTIAFNIKDFDHGLTAAVLNDYYNIQLRNGCFCAHPYVREILKYELWALNIDPNAPNAEAEVERKRGMARASLGIYTTTADIEALVDAVIDLVRRKQEFLALYEPEGPSGYRHCHFTPAKTDLFDPEIALSQALDKL